MSVTTSLRLNDQMTSVLKGMTSSLNLTLNAMEEMKSAMDDSFDDSSIKAARKSIQETESALKQLDGPIRDADMEQQQFNNDLKKGEGNAGSLLKKIAGFVAAYAGFRQVKGFISDSRDLANEQIFAEQRLLSIMSNVDGTTQDNIASMKALASELQNVTTIGDEVSIAGMSQLGTFQMASENVEKLTPALQDLAVATYGVEVSQDQMIQSANLMGKVMEGQVGALSRVGVSFNETQEEILKTGTETERAAALVEVLGQNFGGLAESMAQTPQGMAVQLANEWGDFKEAIGYGLIPVFTYFLEVVQEYMPYIQEIFTTVFQVIFEVLEHFLEYIVVIANFFIENWSWLEPIVVGLGAAIAALAVVIYGVAAAQAVWNAVQNANPIYLIISLVVGLIAWLIHLWQTNDEFAAGLMRAWNAILNFFDQIPIFFAKVGVGIINAFHGAKVKSLQIMQDLVNGVISGINNLIEKLNALPFVQLDTVGQVEFAASAAVEAEAIRQQGEALIAAMESGADAKALQREQKVLDEMKDRAAKREKTQAEKDAMFAAPDLGMPNGLGSVGSLDPGGAGVGGLGGGGMPKGAGGKSVGGTGSAGGKSKPLNVGNIKKVDEVGKIKDEVDISKEDIKMLREYAEMRNVQNFVRLTPNISVKTGDIKETADADQIIKKITKQLEDEIVSSAKGVYS